MWRRFAPALVLIALIVAPFNRSDEQTVAVADPDLVIDDTGIWQLVRAHCTSCHSAKLLKQTRLSRDGWQAVIARMQKDEGLWDLGEMEPAMLDYLAAYYGPDKAQPTQRKRRAQLAPAK